MNDQDDTLDTKDLFGITVRKAPIRYVGPQDEKPRYVEFDTKEKRKWTEAQRKGKKRGPYKKGEQE